MNIMTNEIELENLNPLIKEYENLIVTLKDQLECYKIDYNYLKVEVNTLLKENKILSSYIKTNLQKSDYKYQCDENDLVENLKFQIQFLMKEKESTTALWRNALATIDQLEDELKLHEGRFHGYVRKDDVKKIKEEYLKQIKQLEIELTQTKISLLESQTYTKTIIDVKTNELKQLNETHQETSKAVQNLQNNIQQFQLENQSLQKTKNELTSMLNEKDNIISNLRTKGNESQMKVIEAIQIVDAALIEKDAALLREQKAKDEALQLTKALSSAMEEANKKLHTELDIAKKQHVEKAQKLRMDMKNLTDFLKHKDLELEQQRNATKMLEEKLEIVRKSNLNAEDSNTSKLLILEKNLETTFQKLLLSEKKNIQLEAEKISVKEDLEQMANIYDKDIKTRETEKRVLENKITSLQNDLEVSNSSLVQVASKVEEVNSKLLLIETELRKQLHLKDVKNEKILSNKIKEIEIVNSKLNYNLKKRLETQIQFNKKWKATVNDIIEKLEKRVYDLRQEIHTLRQTKKELTLKLKESEEQLNSCKEILKSLCLDVTKIATFSKEHLIEKDFYTKLMSDAAENVTS